MVCLKYLKIGTHSQKNRCRRQSDENKQCKRAGTCHVEVDLGQTADDQTDGRETGRAYSLVTKP